MKKYISKLMIVIFFQFFYNFSYCQTSNECEILNNILHDTLMFKPKFWLKRKETSLVFNDLTKKFGCELRDLNGNVVQIITDSVHDRSNSRHDDVNYRFIIEDLKQIKNKYTIHLYWPVSGAMYTVTYKKQKDKFVLLKHELSYY